MNLSRSQRFLDVIDDLGMEVLGDVYRHMAAERVRKWVRENPVAWERLRLKVVEAVRSGDLD